MKQAADKKSFESAIARLGSLIERLESLPEGEPAPILLRSDLPTAVIETIYSARRLRTKVFGEDADLFGEPAWDILLDAAVMEGKGRSVTVSSACIASDVPSTTALRYIAALVDRGLLSRSTDPFDHRKRYVHLTPKGRRLLNQYVGELQTRKRELSSH